MEPSYTIVKPQDIVSSILAVNINSSPFEGSNTATISRF